MKKCLYIGNIGKRDNYSFSEAAILAGNMCGIEMHIAFHSTDLEPLPLSIPNELEKQLGVVFHEIEFDRKPWSLYNIKAFKQLVELIKNENFDFIHCNTPVGGLLGRLAGEKCGVSRVIYQAHGFHFYKGSPIMNWLLFYFAEKWLARRTDALITINQEDFELANQKFSIRNNGKVYYVPGVGIDLCQYNSHKDKREKHRSDIGLKENDIACIAMGDLIPRKNYSVAIEAISVLKEEFTNLHFIICGKGPELENLQQLAKEKNVKDRIHFLGFRTDIKELLQAADIFFFTSLQEGLPRSTMEAMASGLPVACSKIRGNTDLVDEGKGGVLFDPENLNAVVSKMRELLSSNFKGMGAYNLEHIKEFSLEKATEYIFEVYKREF